MTQTEIQTLVEWLRGNGVRHFKSADLELVIDPLPEKEDEPAVDNPAKTGKRGKDGYTAEEQIQNYGFQCSDTKE